MASDIIPIELTLTAGSGHTLWAPRWIEDGEEWEAFLGAGDSLYVFPDSAHLVAFIRSDAEHDLQDHHQWSQVRDALADSFVADEEHQFNIVGIPQLVAQSPDSVWRLAELTDTVAILRSIAEVCDLSVIDEVLHASSGFDYAAEGPAVFAGRRGAKIWRQLGSVVAQRWGEVVKALDTLVETPTVSADLVSAAQDELNSIAAAEQGASTSVSDDDLVTDVSEHAIDEGVNNDDDNRDSDLEFWDNIGIDCVAIHYQGRIGWTMRCYLDDQAEFLAVADQIQMFASPAKLEDYLADGTVENSLSYLDAWATIREGIVAGEASVLAGPENTYELDGIDRALLDGPDAVDAHQLELAVELLEDAGHAREDTEVASALSTASPLGNLIRAAVNPDPDRQPPLPPFDDEVAALRTLIETFTTTLHWRE